MVPYLECLKRQLWMDFVKETIFALNLFSWFIKCFRFLWII